MTFSKDPLLMAKFHHPSDPTLRKPNPVCAGVAEALSIAYGSPSPGDYAADFPTVFGGSTAAPDIGALQVSNMLRAADAGLITEEIAADLPKASDPVQLPAHYARFAIEPIRFIGENKLGFLPGNVIKYVLRWDAKDGIQDLYKARRYLDMFILYLLGDPDWWKKGKEPPPLAHAQAIREGEAVANG